jgi:hypothetical protein
MASAMTRRKFIYYTGSVLGSMALVACGGSGGDDIGTNTEDDSGQSKTASPRIIYRLSSRNLRASQASKKHNANKRFATQVDADQNRAHPGDRSRIVPIIVSQDEFELLFDNGQRTVADLRWM